MEGEKLRKQAERPRKDEEGERGRQTRNSGTVYYNHSLCMGLSTHTAHSEIPII